MHLKLLDLCKERMYHIPKRVTVFVSLREAAELVRAGENWSASFLDIELTREE